MCARYCFGCQDDGIVRTWGGQVECFCVGPCESCGEAKTTAAHRHSCPSVMVLMSKLDRSTSSAITSSRSEQHDEPFREQT